MPRFNRATPHRGDQLAAELSLVTGTQISPLNVLLVEENQIEIHESLMGSATPEMLQQVITNHVVDPNWGKTAEQVADEQQNTSIKNDFSGLRTKAKNVYAGTDTFTAAQLQKIVAGLVLRELRRNNG